jgi:S1-C subfamily serine protease
MNAFDGLIIVLGLAAAVGGFRLGFVTRSASWLGMAGGLVLGAFLLPRVLDWVDDGSDLTLLLVAAGVLVGGAAIGQAVGLALGASVRVTIPEGKGQALDRAAGALVGAFGVAVAVWLLLPTMASVPGWPAREARNSAVAGFLSDTLPAPPDAMVALRQLVGDDRFPQVFDALRPAPRLGPPPAATGIPTDVSARVAQSVVKVEGEACSRLQDGTGWVAGEDLVVTNAHVVAGESSTEVQRDDGSRVDADVVAFDPDRDLALLAAPGLERPALTVASGAEGGRGGVYGHPGGGPLEISPFEIAQRVRASGRDIYDQDRTVRDVFVLSAELAPGDSGSALVDPEGEVVGVAFAIAPDRPGVAYALTDGEVTAFLDEAGRDPVDTGPCL